MNAEGPDSSHVDREQCGGSAAPYVLGALTDSELEAFRRHLESCAVCREEVAALQVVASALPAAAPQVRAPAAIKRRVMASVREDARSREADRRLERARGARSTSGTRARRFWPPLPNLALAGLTAAVITFAVVALVAGGSGGARVIRADVFVPRASASLSVSGGRAQLNIADMPQAGPGRVYEVWRKLRGAPQPTDALFTVSSRGDASVGVPGGVGGVSEILVTSEPLGGSQVPTRAPVIVARVS